MRRRLVFGFAVLIVAVAAAATAATVLAGEGDGPRAAEKNVTRTANGSACAAAAVTATTTNIPPDDSTTDNVPALTVNANVCGTLTVVNVSTEIATPNTGDFIHSDIRATCVSDKCIPGTVVYGSPGHTFVSTGPSPTHISPVMMVFTTLPKGVWQFDFLVGGNNSANVQFRTMVVTTYK